METEDTMNQDPKMCSVDGPPISSTIIDNKWLDYYGIRSKKKVT